MVRELQHVDVLLHAWVKGFWRGVWGLWFEVWSLVFGVWVLGCGVWG